MDCWTRVRNAASPIENRYSVRNISPFMIASRSDLDKTHRHYLSAVDGRIDWLGKRYLDHSCRSSPHDSLSKIRSDETVSPLTDHWPTAVPRSYCTMNRQSLWTGIVPMANGCYSMGPCSVEIDGSQWIWLDSGWSTKTCHRMNRSIDVPVDRRSTAAVEVSRPLIYWLEDDSGPEIRDRVTIEMADSIGEQQSSLIASMDTPEIGTYQRSAWYSQSNSIDAKINRSKETNSVEDTIPPFASIDIHNCARVRTRCLTLRTVNWSGRVEDWRSPDRNWWHSYWTWIDDGMKVCMEISDDWWRGYDDRLTRFDERNLFCHCSIHWSRLNNFLWENDVSMDVFLRRFDPFRCDFGWRHGVARNGAQETLDQRFDRWISGLRIAGNRWSNENRFSSDTSSDRAGQWIRDDSAEEWSSLDNHFDDEMISNGHRRNLQRWSHWRDIQQQRTRPPKRSSFAWHSSCSKIDFLSTRINFCLNSPMRRSSDFASIVRIRQFLCFLLVTR